MLSVFARHLGEAEPAFVDRDEGVGPFVGGPAGGHRLQNRHPHHPDYCRILNEDGVARCLCNLLGHLAHLLSVSGRSISAVGLPSGCSKLAATTAATTTRAAPMPNARWYPPVN